MTDPLEQAAWDLVALHGLRAGTATVMTTCEGIIVWMAPDVPLPTLPTHVGDVPVRVARRPSFVRSEAVRTEQAEDPVEDDEPEEAGHAG